MRIRGSKDMIKKAVDGKSLVRKDGSMVRGLTVVSSGILKKNRGMRGTFLTRSHSMTLRSFCNSMIQNAEINSKEVWNLEEEFAKVLEKGLAIGLNFNGRRKELLEIIAKRKEVNDNRFRDLMISIQVTFERRVREEANSENGAGIHSCTCPYEPSEDCCATLACCYKPEVLESLRVREELFWGLAFYKCLGGGTHDDHQDPKTQHVDTNSPSDESERQMKSTEDAFAVLIRRPQRPPGSSGGGGQIN
ncbi:hypothetical protein Dsin_016569 [Dipteronia sinensis]|uniref:Uncharacterized protein n=1 Tax=Dipteronia sinensis TaxID=43782 RepID=A0AAE0AE48_9ROSI|nr:hypothetical protein Dsin_016569 [Dipteronia sinensis]